MPSELKIKCIVLSTADYGDHDRMLTLFSPEHGRIDARARNCRKATSPLLSCVQPFTYGEYLLFHYKDKNTVNQGTVLETFYPLREDADRFTAAAFAGALVRSAAQDGEENEALFSLLYRTFSYLAYGENTAADMLTAFLVRFLSVTGFQPALTRCAVCGADLTQQRRIGFDAEKGGAVCFMCAPFAKSVSPRSLEAMRRILLLEEEDLNRVTLPEELRREILETLLPYTLCCVPGVQKAADSVREILLS